MSKDIGVIEQLSEANARPTYHVSQRIAAVLIESGQCVWAIAGKTLRKTPKHGRLERDEHLMAGRAFAVRGLSAQVGAIVVEAIRNREPWAIAMVSEIRKRLPRNPHIRMRQPAERHVYYRIPSEVAA